jgi:hypothetical protein
MATVTNLNATNNVGIGGGLIAYKDAIVGNNLTVNKGITTNNIQSNIGINTGTLTAGTATIPILNSGTYTISGPDIKSTSRMHISGPEDVFFLNKGNVNISKAWGGPGNLNVDGTTNAKDVNITGRLLITRPGSVPYSKGWPQQTANATECVNRCKSDYNMLAAAFNNSTKTCYCNQDIVTGGVDSNWTTTFMF